MKKFIKKIIKSYYCFSNSLKKEKYYKSLLKKNLINNIKSKGEDKWIDKWSKLDKDINPVYYRLFSSYIGEEINIVPDNICQNIIEPILNPRRFIKFYADKNIFDKLFPLGTLPLTILRKMGGTYLKANYEYVAMSDEMLFSILKSFENNKIVIKPSLDTSSGAGVKVFYFDKHNWRDVEDSNVVLNCSYLENKYGENFIIQECLEQSSWQSIFNESSVNTLRLTLYRSVKTNECVITSAIMRIGNKGSVVDNAHAGGRYVGIYSDGTLGKVTLDQWGNKQVVFNGIDFSKEYKVPNWKYILEFSKSLGKCIPHCRLIALDLMLTKDGSPKLIEYNVSAYSPWLFQFTSGSALGEYTDEIIDYCKKRKLAIENIIIW